MTLRVAILDMQPIDPPVGGGRLRLLGLYHALGADVQARYVGSYDWPGPGHRRQMLSDGLEEILVPLSPAHFAAAEALRAEAGGRVVIDTAFAAQAHLSPDYLAAAREAVAWADVVVFSHPWCYLPLRDALDPARQAVVYDAHNVEAVLRAGLLDDGGAGSRVVRGVVAAERALCRAADLILACSHEDRAGFGRLYGVPADRVQVVPNASFTDALRPPSAAGRRAARRRLGLDDRLVAFFLGSAYGPNATAARFIATTLAPALPEMLFVVGGGAGESLDGLPEASLVRRTGAIPEAEKQAWLHAADIAVNPMFSGSGTNIKMLDFMAAGLPILSTPTGARGIETGAEAFLVADRAGFAVALAALAADPAWRAALGETARREAERRYDWGRVSARTGQMLRRAHGTLRRRPHFSLVVAPGPAAGRLPALLRHLAAQSVQDFELVVAAPEPPPPAPGLEVVHVPVAPGPAVAARNAGAAVATGRVLAFIDAAAEPPPGWLAAAQAALADPAVAGLQGEAGLFLRADAFHAAGGFDICFEREEALALSNLLWRARLHGLIAAFPPSLSAAAMPDLSGRRVALVSTWGVTCGIAEYSRYLLEGMGACRPRLQVFCDTRTAADPYAPMPVQPAWTVEDAASMAGLAHALATAAPEVIAIQHHPGYIWWTALRDLLADPLLLGRPVVITLHNTRHLFEAEVEDRIGVIRALARCSRVLVHAPADLDLLRGAGLRGKVALVPHGGMPANGAPSARDLPPQAAPVIGCFGFFLPHKGIHELIAAAAALRQDWPGLRLRLVNAAYPRVDSAEEIDRCHELARGLGVEPMIEWHTAFLPEADALALLHGCDVVALPYRPTPEAASGALRMALASGAPVAVSPVAIFDEAAGAVARLPGFEPEAIAAGLRTLLHDAPRRATLQRHAAAWGAERSWERVAGFYAALLERALNPGASAGRTGAWLSRAAYSGLR